mgnify:CR=1 FL=1
MSYTGETIDVPESRLFETKENVTISNVIILGDGAQGGTAVARAANTITISSGFEVQIGGQFATFSESCGIP